MPSLVEVTRIEVDGAGEYEHVLCAAGGYGSTDPLELLVRRARRVLRRVLDRAGIARIDALGRVVDIHALRHTAATSMARRGVPLVVAQRVLGHASPEMTAKVYTHLGLEDLRGAVEEVGGTMRTREVAGR